MAVVHGLQLGAVTRLAMTWSVLVHAEPSEATRLRNYAHFFQPPHNYAQYREALESYDEALHALGALSFAFSVLSVASVCVCMLHL